MTEKQRIAQWEIFVHMVISGTLTDKDEDEETRNNRVAALEADPEQWFRYYFPNFAYAPAAGFQKAATSRVLTHPEWCEVRMWSRELAKSTRTMMEVFYLVLVGHKVESERAGAESDIIEYEEIEGRTVVEDDIELDENETEQDGTEQENEKPSDRPAPRTIVLRPDNTAPRSPVPRSHIAPRTIALRSQNSAPKKRCVLLISNSLDNATRLLMPYKANLEYNQRIIQDYGPQQGDGTWTTAEMVTPGGISFRAVGVGQSPRGTRNEEVRPDIIIFDDTDTDADCLNAEIVARKWRWIEEAAIGTRSISEDTTIIFCGNRIAMDSCIQRASGIADHTDVVNIRNDDGRSSWPQKNSETDIDRVLSQKSYAAQQKEYFNNPVSEGSVFKQMAFKPTRPLSEYSLLVCYTDPSYKDTADYKATVLVGKWKSEFHVLKCYLEQATTAQMIDWHYRIMDFVHGFSCYFYMEQVFMQDVLVKEVNDAGKRTGRPIPIRGDTRRKPDKFTRIESLLEPMNRNGELFLNEAELHNPHMQKLVEQFCAFGPGSRAHDDGPDAVEGAIWVITEKMRNKDNSDIRTGAKPLNDKRF